jgi:hypothetical protein
MGLDLQIVMFSLAIITLIYVILNIRNSSMDIHYSISWLVFAICIVIMSIFPGVISFVSRILHISTPVFTLFLIMISFLYALTFYLYMKISVLRKEVNNLTYEAARLDKELKDKLHE